MAEPQILRPFTLPAIPRRPADGHKGTFGKILVIGGSIGMSGAVSLASVAALRAGSGLVTAVVPRAIQNVVASYEPCIMTVGLRDDVESGLSEVSEETIQSR
jgi:ADP-dependent NAD(P)H-hydrate dehydratase